MGPGMAKASVAGRPIGFISCYPLGLQIKTHLRGSGTDTVIELEGTVSHGSALTVITYNTEVTAEGGLKFNGGNVQFFSAHR